ncbi:putative AraC family transcriptional regulator [Oscillibacter valericigenes Sjm18-20]|nr:putative AraC family transcriptional regulator [Oscillibacter valericigenes Sjm18-20]
MENTLLKLTDTAFPLQVIEHRKSKLGTLFPTHLHDHHLQLFYFLTGSARIYVNQTPFTLDAPVILLVNPGELHYGEELSGETHYFVYRVDLNLMERQSGAAIQCLRALKAGPLQNRLSADDNAIAAPLLQLISVCRERPNGYELTLLGIVFSLLGTLLHTYSRENCCRSEVLMKKQQRFAAVFSYLEKHYAQPISLRDAAAQVRLSESYFCRLFRQSTGRTPIEYLNRLRIEKAVDLLNQGGYNVTEAAMVVGFDDANYFSRVFKKYMSQSPEHYLKNDRRYYL